MRPLPADDYDTPQPKPKPEQKPSSSSNVVELNAPLNEVKPTTRVDLGKKYGVSSAAIGNWIKQIREVWEPRSEAADLTTPDNLISTWGQEQLARFQEIGASAYELEIIEQNPIHNLSRFAGEEPEEIETFDVEDAGYQQQEIISLVVQNLESRTQEGFCQAERYRNQTGLRRSRSRQLRQNLLIRQGQADAAEDLALYQKSYDSALAQGLAAEFEGEDDGQQ